MISADGNKKHIRNTPIKVAKLSPLTAEDVRKISGYENCSEETALELLEHIRLLANLLISQVINEEKL